MKSGCPARPAPVAAARSQGPPPPLCEGPLCRQSSLPHSSGPSSFQASEGSKGRVVGGEAVAQAPKHGKQDANIPLVSQFL